MRTMFKLILPVAMLASGAVMAQDKEGPVALKDHPDLEGYTATGEVKRCIGSREMRGTNILDNWTMRFRAGGGKYYVSRLTKECRRLDFYQSYIRETHGGSLCAREFIYVLEGGSASPVPCQMGEFHEYTKDKKADK